MIYGLSLTKEVKSMWNYKRLQQSINNIRQEQWVLFFVHLSVWLMLFVAFSLFSLRHNESMPVFVVSLYLYGFLLFYLNYFLVTPKFLLPKKYLAFSGIILTITLVSFLLVDPVIRQLSFEELGQMMPPRFPEPPAFDKEMGRPVFPIMSPGMLFLLITSLTFSSSVRIFQKLKREENINYQYKHEKLNAELMLLRQQVNPHFLFNSLNNIHSLANRKSDLTSEAIVKLSSILRYMLSEDSGIEIPIAREIVMITNYIELQKLWMKNAIQVDFVVEDLSEEYCIEPFILNPLVENAFKYGALPGVNSVIRIHLKMLNDWLHVKITNPVLREHLSSTASMGIGVNNVIRRLELCYPGDFKMENERIGDLYMIDLSMKLKKCEIIKSRN